MKRKEKIRFFLELLNCNYELHFWQYDKEYHLIETNWNNELFSGDFFSYVGLESLLKKRETEKKWNPVILEAGNNLLWLAGFERAEEKEIILKMPKGRVPLKCFVYSKTV